MRKASNEQLIESYKQTSSVWKTAMRFGMCGQSVQERLKRLGKIKSDSFTKEDVNKIKLLYNSWFIRGDGKLDSLCLDIGRTKQSICAYSKRKLRATNKNRGADQLLKNKFSCLRKEWLKKNEHPRGALGIKHSSSTLRKISIASKKAWASKTEDEKNEKTFKMLRSKELNGTLHMQRHKATWKSGWRNIGGRNSFYRSRWEANYARYLEWLRSIGEIISWEYEPTTFWFDKIKRGVRSYLPDFKVVVKSGGIEYHEVKGWMDGKSVTKIKRMRRFYPETKLIVIDSERYRSISRTIGKVLDFE